MYGVDVLGPVSWEKKDYVGLTEFRVASSSVQARARHGRYGYFKVGFYRGYRRQRGDLVFLVAYHSRSKLTRQL